MTAPKITKFWSGLGGVVLLMGGVLLFAGGVGAGIWFTQNFDVVRKGDPVTLDSLDRPYASVAPTEGMTPAIEPADHSAERAPFAAEFRAGERLDYTLKAAVGGMGRERGEASPVQMQLDSAFHLDTKRVGSDGSAVLTLAFDRANFAGNFMGSDYAMNVGPDGSTAEMGGRSLTGGILPPGQSGNIPQLGFFNEPIHMEVGPDGEVRRVTGGAAPGELVRVLPELISLEMPEGNLREGQQWHSPLELVIPGIGVPVPCDITNTFMGYETVAGNPCAVIAQEIVSTQENGTLAMPQGAWGEAQGFSMPGFHVNGANKAYVDTNTGQLVYSDMHLDIGIDIGKTLGDGASTALRALGAALGELAGDLPEFEDMTGPNGAIDLLNLNLGVDAQLSLVNRTG